MDLGHWQADTSRVLQSDSSRSDEANGLSKRDPAMTAGGPAHTDSTIVYPSF